MILETFLFVLIYTVFPWVACAAIAYMIFDIVLLFADTMYTLWQLKQIGRVYKSKKRHFENHFAQSVKRKMDNIRLRRGHRPNFGNVKKKGKFRESGKGKYS